MSPAYDVLSAVYDHFQTDIDPQIWAARLHQWIQTYRLPHEHQGDGGKPLLVDLGCGTGRFLKAFSDLNYDLIGIDASSNMLEHCRERFFEEAQQPILLQQDLRQFELYGTVDVMICLLDTVNHLTAEVDLAAFFDLCHNYLHPGGVFIFDCATAHHFEQTLGDRVFFSVAADHTLWWQNTYQQDEQFNRADLILFEPVAVDDLTGDDLYLRRDTTIEERFYPLDVLCQQLQKSGFKQILVKGDQSDEPQATDERWFIIAQSGKHS